MREKTILFSVTLFITIAVIVGLSIIYENELFENMTKTLALPLLVFTFINSIASVLDKVIKNYTIEIGHYESQLSEKRHLSENAISALNLDDNIVSPSYKENLKKDQYIFQMQCEYLQRAIKIQDNIINKMRSCMIFDIIYIISFTAVMLSMFLSPIIARCFDFITASTLTLIALLLVIAEVLLSNVISDKLSIYLYKKESIKEIYQDKNNTEENDYAK